MLTPQSIDARSRELHRLVAEKIRSDPSRFRMARDILARWRVTVSPSSQPYLREWEAIFDQGMERALTVAVESSEHADALRQCSPLACVLTNRERWSFLKEWRRRHDADAA